MSGGVTRPSVNNLIDDIRKLYNESKTSVEMSYDLVDQKLEKRSTAQQRELARNVARASKQFNELFKTRSFYEKIIERSRTVNAPSTISDRQCSTHGNNLCSCESLASVSPDRRLHAKIFGKAESCSWGKIPQILNAPRKLIKHIIGEIVLQLEKRIILHVFPDSRHIYYGPLEDIREVIMSESDKNDRAKHLQALDCRIQKLQPLGWDMNYHVAFGNRMMQLYGVGAPAWFYDEPDPLVTHAQLARIITKTLPLEERLHMTTILSCLLCLALEDGQSLFLTCRGEEFQTVGKA